MWNATVRYSITQRNNRLLVVSPPTSYWKTPQNMESSMYLIYNTEKQSIYEVLHNYKIWKCKGTIDKNTCIIHNYCMYTSNLVIQLAKTSYTAIDPVLFSSWSEKLYEHNKVGRMARCWEESTSSTSLVYRTVVTWHWHKLYLQCYNWQKIWRHMYDNTTLLCLS